MLVSDLASVWPRPNVDSRPRVLAVVSVVRYNKLHQPQHRFWLRPFGRGQCTDFSPVPQLAFVLRYFICIFALFYPDAFRIAREIMGYFYEKNLYWNSLQFCACVWLYVCAEWTFWVSHNLWPLAIRVFCFWSIMFYANGQKFVVQQVFF